MIKEGLWLPLIDEERCTGCGDCVGICPTAALALIDQKAQVVEPAACDYSAVCEAVCPVEAIALPYRIIVETG